MKNFITELYYGNIDPQCREFKKDSYLQKQMKSPTESEELLTNNLTGEEKKAFLSFANASNVILGESELDAFIVEFRLANYNKIYTIDVYEKEGSSKHYIQRIVIYYRFVGYIEIPTEPDYENYTADTRQGVKVEYLPAEMFPSQRGKTA